MAVPDGYCLMGKATLQTSGEYKGIRDVIAKYSDAKREEGERSCIATVEAKDKKGGKAEEDPGQKGTEKEGGMREGGKHREGAQGHGTPNTFLP
ncbi:unnamed protein product [Enterobius vermicularis]|uniref:Dehydrin 7 n=1 Tax=Enterobius vermicularis TaxID=51028 RepID=A0A0N4VQZ1_ENTVE|nr:unnamed protein product [Enterobius vermicularis]